MFLRQLYRHNKGLFAIFLFFLASFAFLNYKWGLTATPVCAFGMYSANFKLEDTQQVLHIYVNGRLMDMKDFDLAQRDMMVVSPEIFYNSQSTNETVHASMNRIFHKVLPGLFADKSRFMNNTDEAGFLKWYARLIGNMTGDHVTELSVFRQKYLLQNGNPEPVSSPQKIY